MIAKVTALVGLLLLGWPFATVQATLIDSGYGLIYDTALNITWLQDANYADTAGYDDALYGIDTDGTMYWNDARTWAANLVYQGFDDWRLPRTQEECYGPNPCTGSEMGHLYWIDGITAAMPPLFLNVRPGAYWSESDLGGTPWYFPFSDGSQGIDPQNPRFYAWAVRNGDVASVPEPSTFFLLASGLALIVLASRRRESC